MSASHQEYRQSELVSSSVTILIIIFNNLSIWAKNFFAQFYSYHLSSRTPCDPYALPFMNRAPLQLPQVAVSTTSRRMASLFTMHKTPSTLPLPRDSSKLFYWWSITDWRRLVHGTSHRLRREFPYLRRYRYSIWWSKRKWKPQWLKLSQAFRREFPFVSRLMFRSYD